MSILASIVIGCLIFVFGFQALTLIFSNHYSILRKVSSTFLGDDLTNIKISTAILYDSETSNNRFTGLIVTGNKVVPSAQSNPAPKDVNHELIIPVSRQDIVDSINMLRNGEPLEISLGKKKEMKITLSEDSNFMKFVFNKSFLFRQGYLVKTPIGSMNELISGFEELLEEESLLARK